MGKKAVSNLDRVLKSRNITLPTKVCIIKAMVFTVVMYRCESWTIKLSAKGLMLSKCVAGEDSWESLGQQGNQTSQSSKKSILNVHWKDWCWSWNSNPLATWCKELTHWKRPWCWERLRAGGEGDDRGRDGWMASLIQWTRVWANSRRETWGAAVHGVAKRWTRLGDCTNNVKFPCIVYDSGFSSSRLKLAFCLSCVLKKKKKTLCVFPSIALLLLKIK